MLRKKTCSEARPCFEPSPKVRGDLILIVILIVDYPSMKARYVGPAYDPLSAEETMK
jgi:hypothetical protein